MVYEQRGPKKPGTLTPNSTPKAPAKEKGKLLSSMKKKPEKEIVKAAIGGRPDLSAKETPRVKPGQKMRGGSF